MSDTPSPFIPRRLGVQADPFAAAPITIGELTDVPAPLAPIRSQWAQEVTNRCVHRFTTNAQMNAWAAGDGSLAYTTESKGLWLRRNGAWVQSSSALVGPVTITNDTSGGGFNLKVTPPAGAAGDEGGQIEFGGSSANTLPLYIDRFQNSLRIILNGTVVSGYSGSGIGFVNGTHPVHGTGYVALYRANTSSGGDYAMLQNASDLFLNTAASGIGHLRVGNGEVAYWDANGFRMDGAKSLYWPAFGGGWYMSDGTWMRSVNDKNVYCGGGWFATEGGLSIAYNGGTDATWRCRVNSNSWVGGTMNANYVESRKVAGGSYADQTAMLNPGNTMTGLGFHPGGVAMSIRMQTNNARMHFNNLDSSWYYDIVAASFSVASSLAKKRNVIDLPVARPVDVVRALRPVWFQTPTDLDEPIEVRDDTEHHNIVERRTVVHDCDTSPHCSGSSAAPCQRVLTFEQGRVGFVAEEIERVFPVIASHDPDGSVMGYDSTGLLALVVAAVQNLTDDIEELRRSA